MYYKSVNEKLKKEYGCKVYKLALSGGMTCPNRDGKIGHKGCVFCSEKGSGDFAEPFCDDIFLQIENAKKRVEKKNKNGKYIAYFQSFTNTYAPPEYLEKIFFKAISHPDIVILSVATRPDCLDNDVLNVLERVARIKPLWVELGLQTTNEDSVKYIRRGFDNSVYKTAVSKLHQIGAEVITHIILGLPNETKEDMLNTLRFSVNCGTDGVKLQLLHILKNTDLATDYLNGRFKTLELDEYIDILCDCIEELPENIIIHRITGDGDKKLLIEPEWSSDKKRVLNTINRTFTERNIIQGKKLIREKKY